MRLLFLAVSQRAYGETVIGLSLARQLARRGVQSHFVVEAAGEPVVAQGGSPTPRSTRQPARWPG